MNKTKAFLLELRAPFLTVSILPVVVGTAAAFSLNRTVNWSGFWWVLLTYVLFHLGTNVWNDYWDDRNGTDRINREYVFPFTGGSRLIQQGALSARAVWWQGAVLFAAALGSGVLLAAWYGYWLLIIWLVALISGAFYTAPPFRWAHTGWGEILVGLNFGPLPMAAAYFIQTGRVEAWPILLSLPIGFLAVAILYVNQFPDFQADKASGKRNWVVRLGPKKARWGLAGLLVGAYAVLIVMLGSNMVSNNTWFAFVGLPLAAIALRQLWVNYSTPAKLAPACVATIALHLVTSLLLCGVLILG